MYRGLYDRFAHWYYEGSIYFYSDTHFDDQDLPNRPTAMEQVKLINAKVGKKDTIVFLGDVGNPEYIEQIRGYKVLVMGNHDAGRSNYGDYFDEIYEGVLTISDKIILSHERIEVPWAFNIHGHIHNGKALRDKMHLNVCAEVIDFTPVRLKDIIESGILKNVQNIHREAIDKATSKKKKIDLK